MTLESRPTTAAVLAAESLRPGMGFAMLKGIQHAHYERGLHVVEPDVLRQIATEVGLDSDEFEVALTRVDTDAHIASSRRLMAEIGARGFPAFVLELEDRLLSVPHGAFAADPPGFAKLLARTTHSRVPA